MNNSNGGLTFAGALQIAIIVLKLTGLINCSWFIALLPIELTLLIGILLVTLYIFLWKRG